MESKPNFLPLCVAQVDPIVRTHNRVRVWGLGRTPCNQCSPGEETSLVVVALLISHVWKRNEITKLFSPLRKIPNCLRDGGV